MSLSKISALCFEAGGVWGLAYIGAVQELSKYKDLKTVQTFCGTSAGSLASFALSIGVNNGQWNDIMLHCRRMIYKQLPSMVVKLPWNICYNYGIIPHEIVRDFAKHILQTVYPDKEDILFEELNKKLIITATNLSDSYFFIASKQTTPKMSVLDAVCYSCCGNFALTPNYIKLRKQKIITVVDGGDHILNYPFQCIL